MHWYFFYFQQHILYKCTYGVNRFSHTFKNTVEHYTCVNSCSPLSCDSYFQTLNIKWIKASWNEMKQIQSVLLQIQKARISWQHFIILLPNPNWSISIYVIGLLDLLIGGLTSLTSYSRLTSARQHFTLARMWLNKKQKTGCCGLFCKKLFSKP